MHSASGDPREEFLCSAASASAGRRNASVLPDPVFAIARRSNPRDAIGHAAPCTALGSANPCLLRSVTSGFGNGASSNARHAVVGEALS